MKEELTWRDMKAIVDISRDLNPFNDTEQLLFEFLTEEAFYTEILKRFNETKK